MKKGYLTKDELVRIYDICGRMLHAHNPYSDNKPLEDVRKKFPEWLTKIYILICHHKLTLIGGQLMVVAIMERSDNGFPQAVIMKKTD